MVDATASGLPGPNGATAPRALKLAGHAPGATARTISLETYGELCRDASFAPSQSHSFVSAWISAVRPDHLIVSLWDGGRPVLALPLEVVRRGPFRVARFMGGTHANSCFPACHPRWAVEAGALELSALMHAIGSARPDIDLVLLERMEPRIREIGNPLMHLAHRPSPNIALSTSLAGGFEALLERAGSKRKRKKHRAQTRKFEAAGGSKVLLAKTPEQVDRLWSAFLAMKEHRFRKMGIANVFGDDSIKLFFRTLFVNALDEDRPSFYLQGLEVGGTLRAVTGTSRSPGQITCEFGAIAEDDLSSSSPGDFLFYEAIKAAADSGLAFYDFGVGDEPYKRVWCDTERTQFDAAFPLTTKGRLLSVASRATARSKAAVKNNPVLWPLVKRLRKGAAGQPQRSQDESPSGQD